MSFLFLALAVLLFTLSLTPYLPFSRWITDLASHFVLHWAAGAIIMLLLCIVLRVQGAGVSVLLLTAYFLCLFQLLPFLPTPARAEKKGDAFRILHANVWVRNGQAETLHRLIEDESPDMVALTEITPPFTEMASELAAEYPHQYMIAGNALGHSIAVLLKSQPDSLAELPLTEKSSALVLRVDIDGKAVDIVVLHAANPVKHFSIREREFGKLAAWHAERKPERVVIVGDLNATPYCPAMKTMMRRMGLTHARKRRRVAGTFPTQTGIPLLRLPIDHVLTGGDVTVADFHPCPDIGSDHLPVVATLRF